jgi:hypothetical protein
MRSAGKISTKRKYTPGAAPKNPQNSIKNVNPVSGIAPVGVILKVRIQLRGGIRTGG